MATNNPQPRIADAGARADALNVSRSIIVQAPAGSGKTELLMLRFLTLLASGSVEEPEAVVAITFTRKAASEMRNRILQTLEQANNPEPREEHRKAAWELARAVLEMDRKRNWQLLKNPTRLRIRTLDSLCDSLARQIPMAAGLGASLENTEDFAPLYREAARRTVLALGEGDNSVIADSVAHVLLRLDNDVAGFERMLVLMLGKRDQWLRLLGRSDTLTGEQLTEVRRALEDALGRVIRYELGKLREAVGGHAAAHLANLLFYARYAASNFDARDGIGALDGIASLPGTGPEDYKLWAALRELCFTQKDLFRKRLTVNEGFPSGGSKQEKQDFLKLLTTLSLEPCGTHLAAAFERLGALPPRHYEDSQWDLLAALFRILPVAVGHLKAVFLENGATDFIEVASAALQALGVEEYPSDLAFALGPKMQHILVDEFQDTSATQMELLKRLTAAWDAGNTLFAVGDPMQSIYGFREAEVALFQRARESTAGLPPLVPITLEVNFRSQQLLIDWFNRTFAGILTSDDQITGAVKYAHAAAIHPPAGGDALTILPLPHGASDGPPVAGMVKRALGATSNGKVAILVRARNHLKNIVPELRAANIRFRAVDIDPLAERQIVRDLDALTQALPHLGDRTAWLAVLRAPWCGLKLADLWELCRGDQYSAIWDLLQSRLQNLSGDGQRRVERLRAAISPALQMRGRIPLRRWVESVWISIGGPAAVREGDDGEADLRDAAAYFELLDRCEVAGGLPDRARFVEQLAKLNSPPDTAGDIRVELMTIHGAKGLEFDTVILPGLDKKTKANEKKLLNWRELFFQDAASELLLAPIERSSNSKNKNPHSIEKYLGNLNKERELEENKRLLYVAATRAKRELILVFNRSKNDTAPQNSSLLASLWKSESFRLQAGEIIADSENVSQEQDIAQKQALEPRKAPVLRRLALDWKLPALSPRMEWEQQPVPLPASAAVPHTYDWVGETLRRVGTVAHRFLQQIAREGLNRWNEETITGRQKAIRAALASEGVVSSELERAAAKVTKCLRTAVSDERGRWLLHEHEGAACELELSGKIDGHIHRIKVDRTFVFEGERWIIDFKTSDMEGGSLERFLDAQQEKYRPDLERYAALLFRFDGRTIRMALYFPLLGAWREVVPA